MCKVCHPALLLGLLLVLSVVTCTYARTWTVARDGSGDFVRVTDACEAATDGDSILISPGEYYESAETSIILQGKGVAIIGVGAEPRDVSLRMRFFFVTCDGALLENVLIHDASPALVVEHLGSMLVRNCRFERNRQGHFGGAIRAGYGAVLEIEDSVFLENESFGVGGGGEGGAVASTGGQLIVRRCLFVDNTATSRGGAIMCHDNPIIEDCVFFRNEAGNAAALGVGSHAVIHGCTFLDNRVTDWGGTITLHDFLYDTAISHCIISGTVNGFGIHDTASSHAVCCDFWGNEFGPAAGWFEIQENLGNISADPMFCDPSVGDVGLPDGSPCLPGNHGGYDCGLIGAKGLGCGEVPVKTMTWGEIKAVYRGQ